MHSPPVDLVQRLKAAHQEHALADWELLDSHGRATLAAQLQALDFDLLTRLYAQRDEATAVPPAHRVQPLDEVLPAQTDAEAIAIGQAALAAGEVAVLIVAGGQGSRLGFEHPKGMFPVGPVSRKSLFQIHVEKIISRTRRHGGTIPLLVMTSSATHAETEQYFERHQNFGIDAESLYFFQQGTMPALDAATGQLLFDSPGHLALSPNGHGGTLTALADSGLLARLRHQGVRHLFYFQVDNPLVKIADPQFLGQHIRAKSQVSSKAIPKLGPLDKLGNFARVDGRLGMIEYSDLPTELAHATNTDGSLAYSVGNPAIHVFDLDFLAGVTEGDGGGLPFHIARKKVAYWDRERESMVKPERENALKFERFIFDVLPLAERFVIAATPRDDEFAPLKNATGADSPESVAKALSDQAKTWLTAAGAEVDGLIEISPLWAIDAEEVAARVKPGERIAAGTYLS